MKKKFAAMTLAFGLAVTMTACGGTAQEADDTKTQSEPSSDEAAETSLSEIELTVRSHRIETENIYEPDEDSDPQQDPFPYAYVTYDTFVIPEDVRTAYPALAETLDGYNSVIETESLTELADDNEDAAASVEGGWIFTSNEMNTDISVLRADEAIFSCIVTKEAFYGGAHPSTWYESINIDTQTGEYIPLSDVINGTENMKGLPDLIYKNLETVAELDRAEVEEEFQEWDVLGTIEDEVAKGSITWTLDDGGINMYFSQYELMYYAFGPIFCNLKYDEYPDLIAERYHPADTATPLDKRIKYEDTDTVVYSDSELSGYVTADADGYIEGEYDEYCYVECPEWGSSYVADGIDDALTASPLKLTKVSEESLTFAEDWATAKGITLPGFAFGGVFDNEDGDYSYLVENLADEGILRLTLTDNSDGRAVCFEFSQYLVTPSEGNEFTTSYIRYAGVYDGVLYTEITHMTYSADQPDTAYIVAVELDGYNVLWRSDMLVANANNFIIGEDTIICGYGFTAEDDFIYVLSRKSGRTLDKIKVKTAPDYFIPMDDSLYVVCYDRAYEFNVEEE